MTPVLPCTVTSLYVLILHAIPTRRLANTLLASSNLILDGVVTSFPDLRLEVKIDKLQTHQHVLFSAQMESTYLALLGSPLSIGITVVNHLSTGSVLDLDSGVTDGALSVPLDIVACTLADEEWLSATLVAIRVEALLDGEVEDLARSNFVSLCLCVSRPKGKMKGVTIVMLG